MSAGALAAIQNRYRYLTFLLALAVSCNAQSKPAFAVDEEQTQTPEQTARTLNILPPLLWGPEP